MPSMRSAAADSAAAIEACAALLRSEVATRASCKAASSSSRRLTRAPASASSSATVIAAITVKRVSPISPNLARRPPMRAVELAREFLQVFLLTVFAGHAELPAVDGDAHLRHCCSSHSFRIQHVADGCNRLVDARADLAIGGFEVFARAVASSSSLASRARSLSSAWTWSESARAARSASRRRSAAASSASSASDKPRRRGRDRFGLAELAIGCGHGVAPCAKIVCRQLFIAGSLRRIAGKRQRRVL